MLTAQEIQELIILAKLKGESESPHRLEVSKTIKEFPTGYYYMRIRKINGSKTYSYHLYNFLKTYRYPPDVYAMLDVDEPGNIYEYCYGSIDTTNIDVFVKELKILDELPYQIQNLAQISDTDFLPNPYTKIACLDSFSK